MREPVRGIIQLDFDGTVTEGDVSTGILARFSGPEWLERVEAASRRLKTDPEDTGLIDALAAGYAHLTGSTAEHLRYAREHHPIRPGLPDLVATAERLGLDCHVVSNGFDFYIRDYLRQADVEGRVTVHCGVECSDGSLAYLDPGGKPVRGGYKRLWAEHFLARHDTLVYVGDGTSDVAAARLATLVVARDSLLGGLREGFAGRLRPFETLHDVARALEEELRD